MLFSDADHEPGYSGPTEAPPNPPNPDEPTPMPDEPQEPVDPSPPPPPSSGGASDLVPDEAKCVDVRPYGAYNYGGSYYDYYKRVPVADCETVQRIIDSINGGFDELDIVEESMKEGNAAFEAALEEIREDIAEIKHDVYYNSWSIANLKKDLRYLKEVVDALRGH